jgi:hypothetical protein
MLSDYRIAENRFIIERSYKEYMETEKLKRIDATFQLAIYVDIHVMYNQHKLSDWLERFKDEEIALNELKKLQ